MSGRSLPVLTTCALALSIVACSGERFSNGANGDAGTGGRPVADAANGSGGSATGGRTATEAGPDTGVLEAGADTVPGVALSLVVMDDADDATWIMLEDGTYDERLHYSNELRTIEVGTDHENGRVGIRFELPVPAGATLVSATLTLTVYTSSAESTDTVLVRPFASIDLPPFDEVHAHDDPADHVPGGVSTAAVAFEVGNLGDTIVTPDLTDLLQPLVNDPEWRQGNAIGFFLAPLDLDGWVGFADSTSGEGAPVLDLVYTP